MRTFTGCSYHGRSWTCPFPAHARWHPGHAGGTCPAGSVIARRVQVRVHLVAAGLALETCLPGPVAPLRMPTAAAPLAGMPRVLFDNLDTGERCLVADEAQKLRERPGMQHAAHLPRLLGAVADAEQLLDMQNAAAGSHAIDDLTAEAVILAPYPSGLAPLAALDPADLALSSQGLTVPRSTARACSAAPCRRRTARRPARRGRQDLNRGRSADRLDREPPRS